MGVVNSMTDEVGNYSFAKAIADVSARNQLHIVGVLHRYKLSLD